MSRHIVAAQMQRIVYGEFLPVVLGQETMKKYQLGGNTRTRYNPRIDPSVRNSFATAAYR